MYIKKRSDKSLVSTVPRLFSCDLCYGENFFLTCHTCYLPHCIQHMSILSRDHVQVQNSRILGKLDAQPVLSGLERQRRILLRNLLTPRLPWLGIWL
jgi:hypothetical protein